MTDYAKGSLILPHKGFTLVELAIVITIIGLLIGGVLKGQELLQNSRMTSFASQSKSVDAAVLTFRDVYKALPGDIVDPANFIQNCTGSCAISGNANGQIGPQNTINDEINTFWLHLSKAGLVTGVDPNSAWTSTTYYAASTPASSLGGKLIMRNYYTAAGGADWPDGLIGHYMLVGAHASSATLSPAVPNNLSAKLDLKVDDGRPYHGDLVILSTGCGPTVGALVYDPNNSTLCYPGIKAAF